MNCFVVWWLNVTVREEGIQLRLVFIRTYMSIYSVLKYSVCTCACDLCECCLSIDYISISFTVDSIGYVYWIGNWWHHTYVLFLYMYHELQKCIMSGHK